MCLAFLRLQTANPRLLPIQVCGSDKDTTAHFTAIATSRSGSMSAVSGQSHERVLLLNLIFSGLKQVPSNGP
jgi:hypothetical protein